MRGSITVTTTAAFIALSDPRRNFLIIQNRSDTAWSLDMTNEPGLTADNGLVLEASDSLLLTGPMAQVAIRAIHGGSGSKSGRVQGGRVA